MNLKNRDLAEKALVRIEMLQSAIKDVENAAHLASTRSRGERPDCGNLRSKLIEMELDEWRSLFMWALTLTEEEQARIKAAAYDRFLGRSAGVMHWLSETGQDPGTWLAADEEKFRTMIEESFLGRRKS